MISFCYLRQRGRLYRRDIDSSHSPCRVGLLFRLLKVGGVGIYIRRSGRRQNPEGGCRIRCRFVRFEVVIKVGLLLGRFKVGLRMIWLFVEMFQSLSIP